MHTCKYHSIVDIRAYNLPMHQTHRIKFKLRVCGKCEDGGERVDLSFVPNFTHKFNQHIATESCCK